MKRSQAVIQVPIIALRGRSNLVRWLFALPRLSLCLSTSFSSTFERISIYRHSLYSLYFQSTSHRSEINLKMVKGGGEWTPKAKNLLLQHIDANRGDASIYLQSIERACQEAAKHINRSMPRRNKFNSNNVKSQISKFHKAMGATSNAERRKVLFIEGRRALGPDFKEEALLAQEESQSDTGADRDSSRARGVKR